SGTQRRKIPRALEAILRCALAHDPARRYRHAGELERALRDFLRAPGGEAAAEPTGAETTVTLDDTPDARAARRNASRFLGVLGGTAFGIALGAALSSSERSNSVTPGHDVSVLVKAVSSAPPEVHAISVPAAEAPVLTASQPERLEATRKSPELDASHARAASGASSSVTRAPGTERLEFERRNPYVR